MNELSKKYYGLKNISIVANGWDMVEDMNDNGKSEDGYYYVCRNQFRFKEILPKPGESTEELSLSEPDYYLESYKEVELFGCNAFIVDHQNVFSNTAESIKAFNIKFGTNFETFEQIFDFAVSEEDVDGNPDGLGFSTNVVYGAKTI